MVIFYALVLILLTKFVQNRSIVRWFFCINIKKIMTKFNANCNKKKALSAPLTKIYANKVPEKVLALKCTNAELSPYGQLCPYF